MSLHDRAIQRDELRDLLNADRKQMAVLYGRRRVGKTYLLDNTWSDDQRVFYFLASDATPEFNRRELLRTVADLEAAPTDVRVEDYPTWRTTVRLLFELYPDEPLVVVLDEFQYLLGGEDDLRSQIVAVWDRLEPDRPLVLVLCGSAVRTMEELGDARAPLYGRLTWRAHLRPFDYWHTGQMVPYDAPRRRAVVYGLYGGMPRYLETIDDDRPLRENVSRDLLSPNGEVRNLVETVVEQERGLQSIGQYKSILTAVARGRTELNEIANFTGLDHDTALRRKIKRLVELGLLERTRNFDAPSNAPYRHRLREPSLQFYYSVISALRTPLETAPPRDLWEDHVRPRVSTHMGGIFENMVEQAYYRLREARDLPVVSEWSRWEGTDRNRESLEVDIVTRLADDRMLTGAIKWSTQPVSGTLHGRHLRDLQRLADSGHAWAHDALADDALVLYAAANGFDDAFHDATASSNHRVLTWSLDDLYSPDAADPRNIHPH